MLLKGLGSNTRQDVVQNKWNGCGAPEEVKESDCGVQTKYVYDYCLRERASD